VSAASVAVVMPSHNHGAFITAALESVFRQTRPPEEVHVIDDGSTDDSVAAIERAFANAGPVRCFLTVRENRGMAATCNELCARVATDFVAFLDADDLYAPTRLERLLAPAPPGGPYFAFSGVEFLIEQNVDETLADWQEEYRLRLGQGMSFPTAGFALLRSNIAITNGNFVMSRGLFDIVGGFDDRLRICLDWDFVLRSLRFVEPTFIPEPLLTYRRHGRNISRDLEQAARDRELLVETLCGWLLGPTVNPLAPTPNNWPHYFRVFASLNTNGAGRSLMARLPQSAFAAPTTEVATAKETIAMRALMAAARAPEGTRALSLNDLLHRCHLAWSRS
jgi:glycosyltransferase involved in cell wall biosynthesis